MTEPKGLGELIHIELFDMPETVAAGQNNFFAAKERELWLHDRERVAEIAKGEAEQTLAVLVVASEINPAVLEALSGDTQQAIEMVRGATPGGLLTELALRQPGIRKRMQAK